MAGWAFEPSGMIKQDTVPASSIRIFDLLWDIFLHSGMRAAAVRAWIVIIGENDTQYRTFVGLSGITDVLDLPGSSPKKSTMNSFSAFNTVFLLFTMSSSQRIRGES